MGYRIVRMNRELFEQMFVEGYALPTDANERIRVTKGLPEGAKLDAVSADVFFDSRGIALRFSHPDWPDPAPGERVPEVRVEFTREVTVPFRRWNFAELTPDERDQLRAELATDNGPLVAVVRAGRADTNGYWFAPPTSP